MDETGWVRRTSVPANAPVGDNPLTGVTNPAGQPDVIRVAWHAGPCIAGATLRIRASDPLSIEVTSGERRCNPCPDVALRYVVDLQFDREISAQDIQIEDLTQP